MARGGGVLSIIKSSSRQLYEQHIPRSLSFVLAGGRKQKTIRSPKRQATFCGSVFVWPSRAGEGSDRVYYWTASVAPVAV